MCSGRDIEAPFEHRAIISPNLLAPPCSQHRTATCTNIPYMQVKTLPALGPRSPSKHPPSVGPETHDGYIRGKKSACKNSNTAGNAAGAGGVVDSAGSTVSTTVVAGKMTQSGRAQTAPGLPPLAKGWRHSALPSVQSTHEIAPSSGLGGELAAVGGATEKGRPWRGKQEAWVEEGEEIYPFATEEEVLPDDRFEVRFVRFFLRWFLHTPL